MQLFIAEQKWIDEYAASGSNGYNILKYAGGGNRGMTISAEHRQKLIDANTGRIVSNETKLKMSEAQIGTAKVVQCKRSVTTCADLIAEAEWLWAAERKHVPPAVSGGLGTHSALRQRFLL